MRIKKIIASNVQEGREMIERELGQEAIILSNRNIKLANGATAIEFVAALDDKKLLENKTKANAYNNSALLKPNQNDGMANEINKKLISEITSLKEIITEVSENVKYKHTGTMPPNLSRVFKIMRNSDISEELALEIVGRITMRGYANDFNQAIGEARKVILNRLQFANPIAKINSRQVITFLGPTGTGKTTSLIKLAIVCKLLHKSNILIVSTDTYKVGGVEQLQTLASISGITFTTAYSPEELSKIIKEEMKGIAGFQNAITPDLTYLVLSATTSELSLINAIEKYEQIVNNKERMSAIVTKVDEAAGLGNIVSALNKQNLQLSYFATGQAIPDDIEPATNEKLNDYLFVV
jgi:flagellar biosynthesis protein FlhF